MIYLLSITYSMVLFAFANHDITYNIPLIHSLSLLGICLLVFLLFHNYLTYSYLISIRQHNRSLKNKLEESNSLLKKNRNMLENKIQEKSNALSLAQQKLETLAHHDPLTCLVNRKGMMQYLTAAMKKKDQQDIPFCVALVNFDCFKKINNTLGHETGDLALQKGSCVMKESIRKQDEICRWAGEEFLVLISDAGLEVSVKIAERLRAEINRTLSEQIDTQLSVTIGLVQCGLTENITSCIKRADKALREGKNKGRNQVIYD